MAKKTFITCGIKAGSPERGTWTHLARSESQSEYRICFILLARGFSHIITNDINLAEGVGVSDFLRHLPQEIEDAHVIITL